MVKSSNNTDTKLRSSVNNKAAYGSRPLPTEDERAQRVTTVRHAGMQLEQKKLAAYKKKKEDRRRISTARRGPDSSSPVVPVAADEQKKTLMEAYHTRTAQKASEERAGLKISAAFVHYHHRFKAIATLQARTRGKQERLHGESQTRLVGRKRMQAAAYIQAHARGHGERTHGIVVRRKQYAMRLQAAYKGKKERRSGESKIRADARHQERLRRGKAAIMLQRVFRGHRARNQSEATVVLLDGLANLSQSAVKIFLEFDSDGSGSIDQDEFLAGIESLGLRQDKSIIDSDVRRVFDLLDTDGGGTLSIKELIEVLKVAKLRVSRKAERARNRRHTREEQEEAAAAAAAPAVTAAAAAAPTPAAAAAQPQTELVHKDATTDEVLPSADTNTEENSPEGTAAPEAIELEASGPGVPL
jgi:hypothetical protein